jgi:hypothetical protein
MAIATGARSQLGYMAETIWGTTPATPALVRLPFTSWSVNLTKETYEDTGIQSDRMQRYAVTGNRHVAGDMDVNYDPANYDSVLESLMYSTWATNVLKVGQVMKSFTMEEASLDITQFRVYTGMIVDKFTVTIPNNGLITGKFSLLGKDQGALTGTTIDTDTIVTAATATPPMTHTGAAGFFKIGGTAVGYITSLTLNVDNGTAQNFGLGVATIRAFTPTFVKVTGSAEVFFEDAVAYNLFVSGASSSIDFKLDNGTKQHQFLIPVVKFIEASKTISGQGPIVMSFNFMGLYDSSTNSNLVITRS